MAKLLKDSSFENVKEEDEEEDMDVLRLFILGGEALTSIPVMDAVRFLVDRVRRSVRGVGAALTTVGFSTSLGCTFSSNRRAAAEAAALAAAVELDCCSTDWDLRNRLRVLTAGVV